MFIGSGFGLNRVSAAGDAYGILNGRFRPALVMDFGDEYYRANGASQTFSDAITHTRASTATMVDSDGALKWGPHNLLGVNSEDLTSGWSNVVSRWAITAEQNTYDGISLSKLETTSTDQHVLFTAVSFTQGQKWTFSGIIKDINAGWVTINTSGFDVLNPQAKFDLTSPAVSSSSFDTASIEDLGDGYRLLTLTYTATLDGVGSIRICSASSGSAVAPSAAGESFYAGGFRIYRSDLGGMVDNPDTGDSYVPTTSAARYLPRRGHHVWNGTAWVNEGLLHESEARTNLLTYSEDLSNAAWLKNAGMTIGTPVTRKGISLDLIENNGATNFRNVDQSFGSVSNGAYATVSVFIEAGTSTETAIRIDDGTSTNRCTVPITWISGVPSLQVDVTAGLTFVDASLQDYGDGLYRTHLTVLNGTGGALTFQAKYYVQWDDTAAAVNTYAGGFQAEIGPTPSSYIPTNSGSTVTRAADVLTIPAANLPWPAPVVIGPELVTNGTFDTDTDWAPTVSSDGTYSFVFVANSTSDYFGVIASATAVGSIDNISVREINPLALSIQMDGRVTYADEDSFTTVSLFRWLKDSDNIIETTIDTRSAETGEINAKMEYLGSFFNNNFVGNEYSPDVFVPIDVANRFGSNFVNSAKDGVADTVLTTPTGLPDLSASNLGLGFKYNGTIRTFRIWAQDIGDAGLVEATEPSLVPSLSLTFDGTENSFIVEDWSE
jgi:hypothetical protein